MNESDMSLLPIQIVSIRYRAMMANMANMANIANMGAVQSTNRPLLLLSRVPKEKLIHKFGHNNKIKL